MSGPFPDKVEGYGVMQPRAFKIRARALGALLSLGLLFGAALLPGCFSSCTGKAAPPAVPAVHTPGSPLPAPAMQTPTTPAPGPAAQPPAVTVPAEAADAAAAKTEDPPKSGLTLDGMRSIREGMTSNEVSKIIGKPGVLIAGTDKASNVYRWNDAGLSFLARFENGKLARKSIITAEGDEIFAEKDERKTIDKDLYNGIHPGMSFDEVMSLIGIEAQPISKNGENVNIYTWRDASGSSFTARFENGKLVKKTGLFVAKGKARGKGKEGEKEEAANAEDQAAKDWADAAAKIAEKADEKDAGNDKTDTASDSSTPPGVRKGRVTVAGASRRERQAENGDATTDRSYHPKAQLPRNLHRLRDGSYEIRIHNTGESRVKAAVVSQEGSAEVSIPPGGMHSVMVNQGDYVVHFIYDDDPYTLHQGGVIPIGQWLTDMEVFLFGGAYNVQVLDHSTDRPVSRGTPPPMINPTRR